MSIEERAINLINNAMQRIKSSIKTPNALILLNKVLNEQSLLHKISNLIHLLVTCNEVQFCTSNEIYEFVKKKHPEAPSDPQALSKWLISFLNYQELEIQNFKTRLIQIELIIKKLSIKINNKNNSLNEQINILKQKIANFDEEKRQISEENNKTIQNLHKELKVFKDKFSNNQKELLLLQTKSFEADKINQTVEILIEEAKKSKIKQQEQCDEVKKKMQFHIDSLNEKNSLMRNDLNYAIKKKFEFENINLTLQDEIQRKNAEILSLQAIIKDLSASNSKISSSYKNQAAIFK